MTCQNCNSPNADGARFCSGCGNELPAASTPPLTNSTGAAGTQPQWATTPKKPDLGEINRQPAPGVGPVSPRGAAPHAADLNEITRGQAAVDPSSAGHDKSGLIGSTIEGKYRIDAKIGAGGMGAVYRAQRLLIGDQVAIKILHAEHVSEPQATERFRREAQAAARLKHANAVSIYDFGVTREGLGYLVMELVEGQSLRQIIKQQGPLTPSAAAEVIGQACAALQVAHQQHIVHRDLKPDNIIVNATVTGLRVKVLDFGIAKLRDMAASNLTQTGSVMGTPHYMSPEQCLGEELDGRSDLYSLGIVLYEMLAGVVPFNSPTSTAVVVQHVNQEPPSLRSMNLSISPALEAVVMHALAKRREDRPQFADALARELSAAVNPSAQQSYPGLPASAPALPPSPASQPGLEPTMVMRTPVSGGTPIPSGYFSPAQGVTPAVSLHAQAASRGVKPITIVTVVAALALVAGSIAVYFLFFSFSAKRAILDEVKKGNLVKPEGSSGYDLYMKHKGKGLSDDDQEEIARKAQSQLEQRGEQIFTNLKQDQTESEAEWAEANRIYSWLNELKKSPAFEARIYFSQASSAFARKDYSGAISDYQRASRLQANWALVLNRLGRCYLNLKDRGSAREFYRQATVAEPGWIMPWLNLGQVALSMKDPYSAEQTFRQAIGIDANAAPAHLGLAQALEGQGRGCEALTEYLATHRLVSNKPVNTINLEDVQRKVTNLTSTLFCDTD